MPKTPLPTVMDGPTDRPTNEDYNSASDEDFDPTIAAKVEDDISESSGDEDGNTPKTAKPQKRKVTTAEDAELDFANSGDEATIRKGKRTKRKADGEDADLDEEDGGEGGLIKTRAQRAKEKKERKPLANVHNATIDVDALWANMNAAPKAKAHTLNGATHKKLDQPEASGLEDAAKGIVRNSTTGENGVQDTANGDDMISIKRTYEFAGETVKEEKAVPKSSAEARLYLQSQQPSSIPSTKTALRRPKKRASIFEPNPTGAVKGLASVADKGAKLNTIEKSKLDWAGYVDKAGIAEELDEHSRAKEGYMGRMDFLGRVEAQREDDLKNARKK
ncbi:MAG: swr complex subunit [Pycnora praestabilis]|nr:MAG: swr complex subunit [Pycnora praestabilis]